MGGFPFMRNGLVKEIFNVDETMLHGVWEWFCNEIYVPSVLFRYIIELLHKWVYGTHELYHYIIV